MKQVFTISLDEELVAFIRKFSIENRSIYRNKSHLVEEAIRKFFKG